MADDREKEFDNELDHLMLWAWVAGDSASEMSLEWFAGGVGVFVLNLLLATPNGIDFFSICILLITAGGTFRAVKYQSNSAMALMKLSRDIEDFRPSRDGARDQNRG